MTRDNLRCERGVCRRVQASVRLDERVIPKLKQNDQLQREDCDQKQSESNAAL